MKTVPFPLCCGANVVCDFGFTKTSMGAYGTRFGQAKAALEDVREFLAFEKEKCCNRSLDCYNPKAFLIAILDAEQKKSLHDLFVEEGFEPLATNVNKNHKHEITIYVWANPDK